MILLAGFFKFCVPLLRSVISVQPAHTRGSVSGSKAADLEEGLWLCPIENRRRLDSSREGMLEGFSLGNYLLFVEYAGRLFRPGKGVITAQGGGGNLSISPRLGEEQRDLAQHNRHLGVAAVGAVKANFSACQRDAQLSRQRLHHGVALIAGLVQNQKITGVASSRTPWWSIVYELDTLPHKVIAQLELFYQVFLAGSPHAESPGHY